MEILDRSGLAAMRPGECLYYTDTHGDAERPAIVVSIEGDKLIVQHIDHPEPQQESIDEIIDDGFAYRMDRSELEAYWRRRKNGLKAFQRARQRYAIR